MRTPLAILLCVIVPSSLGFGDDLRNDSLARTSRVIGGENIDTISEWPWLVSISAQSGRLGPYYCGASVLNDKWLLTAAHCFKHLSGGAWTARMASIKRWATAGDKIADAFGKLFNRKDWQQYEYSIDDVIIHEGYNEFANWKNDIALMKVSGTIPTYSGNAAKIKAISLPERDTVSFPFDGQKCVMTGWGCDEAGGPVEYWAKAVNLPKVKDADCARSYYTTTDTRLCAGYFKGDKGICPGDSGGPLVCKQGDKWIQVGVASFTSRDHPDDYYGVFTRVSTYVDWINARIW